MESYCVIEFKDKQEKVLVNNLLVTNTDVDFKMTNDLKKFVSEKFSVKITDYIEMKDQSTDTDQEKEFEEIKTEAIDSPSINIATDIDNTQNLMEDYGTYVPYLERPVEPKKEIVDNDIGQVVDNGSDPNITTMSEALEDTGVEGLKKEVIDGVANISVDDVLVHNKVDTPSSSTTTRSGRVTKKPRYSIDEDNDEEYIPSIKYSKTTDPTEKKDTRQKSKCNNCGKKMNISYSVKMDHVVRHTNIMQFKCLVDGCGLKFKLRDNIAEHMRRKHPNQLNTFTSIELTSKQNDKLNSMIKKCFGEQDCNSDDHCQVCYQNIGGKTSNASTFKKEHALHHVNFMLYKCMENECQFEGNSMRSMKNHGSLRHKTGNAPKYSKIELTTEQKLEIEDVLVKCFPNLDRDGSAT